LVPVASNYVYTGVENKQLIRRLSK